MIEPGPRTARKPGVFRTWTDFLVLFAIVAAAVAICGTAAMLVYLLVSGKA